jgi:hypothetical protein
MPSIRVITGVVLGLAAATATAQLPILHYPFDEGAPAAATTQNLGTLTPVPSPIVGHTTTGNGQNATSCLLGAGGTLNEVTTPYAVSLGTGSWTIGFCINNSANPGGFQYVFSENLNTGWRIFTSGASGAGNIRMTGDTLPTVNITGGAGDSGWVHVAFVHDTLANQIYAYKDGVLALTALNATPNLSSGNIARIGRHFSTSLLAGTLVDDFRLYDHALTTSEVASWAAACQAEAPNFSKVMITEVSPAAPQAVELTNFGTSTAVLDDWRVKWIGPATYVSPPMDLTILPGTSVVLLDGVTIEPIPPGTQVFFTLPPMPGGAGPFTIGLLDAIGNVVDEMRIPSTVPAAPAPQSCGGAFRGLAGSPTTVPYLPSFERIWGLDSNGGTDWTVESSRSLGRENLSSGPRGTDPFALPVVLINELDDSPDYIELYNPPSIVRDLGGWFVLASSGQNAAHVKIMIPDGTTIPSGGYVVLGDTLTAPSEIPVGVSYVVVAALPFSLNEFDCALYDNFGRLVDLVRAPPIVGPALGHNHPRAPSHWSDFTGSAARNSNGGADAIGRQGANADNNRGINFYPIFTRTMGAANGSSTPAGPPGLGDILDVRLNETGAGQGFSAIINAGSSAANLTFNFLVSTTHSSGVGPFFGLGGDALSNLFLFYNVPPWSGVLDANGSARIDLNPGSLPSGVDADFLFVLQDPLGSVVRRTAILEFDT